MDEKRYNDNLEKVEYILKKHKKDKRFLDMLLINYKGVFLYIIIFYIKKYKAYKCFWYNLDEYECKKHDLYENSSFVPTNMIEYLNNEYSNSDEEHMINIETNKNDHMIILSANIKTLNSDNIYFAGRRYLPKEYEYLYPLFFETLSLLPNGYNYITEDIFADLNGEAEKFKMRDDFEFDLFEGNLNELFAPEIIKRGKKYYKENRVKYIEKIDNSYVAYVKGKADDYVIFIDYFEDEKKMQVFCSCPCDFFCKHLYAVITAIRNKENRKFAKVTYANPNVDLITRIENFQYFLCVGIEEDKILLINDLGIVEPVELYDPDNNCNWKVLTDSCDNILSDLK